MLMASIMLVAFASRVLIPPGFMPASDRPFSIEICWEGIRGPQEGPHHHHGSSSQSEHCVFGTASNAGPIPHLPLPSDFSSALKLRTAAFASIAVAVRVVHLPQPRAPPNRLS
jgi:hypothetical protein